MASDTKFRNATFQPGRAITHVPAGNGLYMAITPQGAKSWRFDFRFNGKRQCLTIGRYPEIPLSNHDESKPGAIQYLAKARAALARGENPAALKQLEKQKPVSADTFKTIAEEWFKSLESSRSASWRENVRRWLDDRIYPKIGSRAMQDVLPADVLAILKATAQEGKARSAEYIRQVIGQIFDHAICNLRANFNPAQSLRRAITLPDHIPHPHIPERELPAFLSKLDAYPVEEHRLAIELLLLTAVRIGELVGATWSEIDTERKEWRIPASRMKGRAEHIVPLSDRALECFAELKKLAGDNAYVLPSPYNGSRKPINDAVLNRAIHKISNITPHGTRSTFSTIANERSGFTGDVIEAALSHVQGDAVRAAYNRTTWLEQRAKLMQWWSDYLDNARAGNVVTLPRRA